MMTYTSFQVLASLSHVKLQASGCYACGLHQQGEDIVFGVGPHDANIMFIGEAPGYNECIDGEPFTGRAGKLLNQIIRLGMGLQRKEVYLCNVLKCRPPENRDPTPDEVRLCSPWLDDQIKYINPELIITVGKFASQVVLKTSKSMGAMRGKVYEIDSAKVVPTWHPAYLLRQPDRNKETWEDIKMAMNSIGMKHPFKEE